MFLEVTLDLLQGFGTTCLIFILTLVLALPLGLIVAFGAMSSFKPLKIVVKTIIWIIRGTPLMLQVMLVYYGPALMFNIPVTERFIAVIIAFVINYACYFAEIYRGGIESITKGQYEAGKVLGMTKSQIFFRVILVQVIKRIIPPMSNEIITLVKDTSLARVIMLAEILKNAQDWAAKGFIWPVFYTGVFYLLFVGLLTIIFNRIEKKLSYFKV
ncbi:MAG: amino acid ABC transporter permease [Clostridiales bacterium]|nr:amino acid ABC transporter permease [Clostridiales bacterium]